MGLSTITRSLKLTFQILIIVCRSTITNNASVGSKSVKLSRNCCFLDGSINVISIKYCLSFIKKYNLCFGINQIMNIVEHTWISNRCRIMWRFWSTWWGTWLGMWWFFWENCRACSRIQPRRLVISIEYSRWCFFRVIHKSLKMTIYKILWEIIIFFPGEMDCF